MGISLSTARVIAPLSYAINFVVQMYGMNSKPNMLDIHNKRFAAFSPWAWAIPIFFSGQQIIQLIWLWRLVVKGATSSVGEVERQAMVQYAPYYALGNLCIAAWLPVWANRLDLSFIFVAINSITQLVYVLRGLPPRTSATLLTHLNAKTFGGIGLLDFVHNLSAGFFVGVGPNLLAKLVTPLASVMLAIASDDWMLGACVTYDLFALALGQALGPPSITGGHAGPVLGGKSWPTLLTLYAGGTGALTLARFLRGPAGGIKI
ncbi:hypothetical protein OIV83_001677 [Microbotryomycetes sp. JL201]|nr:hypothetical protein OIV83_001677 [Microbotryomycetes sp. JL201]